MAVVLRLARYGNKKNAFYRIVAAEKIRPRGGRFLEIIGTYNPHTNPGTIVLKNDLVQKWVALGAKPTEVVANIVKKQIPGFLEAREQAKTKKIQAARKARKARAAKSTKKSK